MRNAPMKPSGLGFEKPTQVEVMGIGSTCSLRMPGVFVFAGLLLEILVWYAWEPLPSLEI
jgi:hypothetical protein